MRTREHRPDPAAARWSGARSLAPVPEQAQSSQPSHHWICVGAVCALTLDLSWFAGALSAGLIHAVLAARRRSATPAAGAPVTVGSAGASDRQAGRV